MTIPEKLLNAIGLERMTNRDVLMEDLAALDNATFEYMVLSRQSDLPEMIENIKCADCKKQHGDKCLAPDDDTPCVTKLADWFSQPCTHDHLIPEVSA